MRFWPRWYLCRVLLILPPDLCSSYGSFLIYSTRSGSSREWAKGTERGWDQIRFFQKSERLKLIKGEQEDGSCAGQALHVWRGAWEGCVLFWLVGVKNVIESRWRPASNMWRRKCTTLRQTRWLLLAKLENWLLFQINFQMRKKSYS